MKLPFNRALVLAPHTDDGEFGCGGTIHRLLSEGCEVRYVAFSDCKESVPTGFAPDVLRHEMAAATQTLGIDDAKVLDYQVRYFPRDRQAILEDMVSFNKRYQPDLVLTPCRQDVHQDHQTITNEAVRAFKRCSIWGYELPWNNLTLPSDTLIKLSIENVDAKIAAIAAYASQAHRTYSGAAYLRALATTRGARIGQKYAEAFENIRIVL